MDKALQKTLPLGKFANVSATRSKQMASVRGKNNRTTEVVLRMALVRAGVKAWMMHPRFLIGRPDIYFPKSKLAVFVDGCFWHGCSMCGHVPKTNRPYWQTKIARNRKRDKTVSDLLRQRGISVLRIWEHDLKNEKSVGFVLQKISANLRRRLVKLAPKGVSSRSAEHE